MRRIGSSLISQRLVTAAITSTRASARAATLRSTHSEASRPAVTTLSEDEEMLRSSVEQFARERIGPKVRSMDEKSELEPALVKECFEQGLMGIEIPQQYGGGGMSFMSAILAIEEVAKVDGSVSVFMDVQNTLVNNAVIRWGTEKQKEQWLPRLAQDTVGSFCLSEWSCGSDAFALKATAKKDGDGYLLNGTKAWITNSKEAGLFLVMATVDPSAGHRGITTFLIDKNTPGISIGKKEDKLGIRASSTCEVVLENCRVPASQVLGEVGKGYKIAIETLNEGRIGIGAQMLGVAEGCFDHTMKYINERKAFNSSIADFQGVQFQYASMYSDILAAKLMVYNAARLKEAGQPFVIDAAIAKLRASEVAEKVASLCINLMGGVGFTKEFPVEKYFRDCKIGQIYEGTSNIQLQTIAKYIQQLYK